MNHESKEFQLGFEFLIKTSDKSILFYRHSRYIAGLDLAQTIMLRDLLSSWINEIQEK